MSFIEPLKLKPALVDRPWGGARLEQVLNKRGASGRLYGESWEVSDHPHARAVFDAGRFGGEFFDEVYRRESVGIFDIQSAPARFPLLIKYIDASENLSVQVHPSDSLARTWGASGKSECWFVIECEPDSSVLCGFGGRTTPDDLRKASVSGDFSEVLMRRPVEPGTFINVPAGTVHSILGGILICEISQSSSEIARLWDWGRKPNRDRIIDVERSIDFSRFPVPGDSNAADEIYVIQTREKSGWTPLVSNPCFEVKLFTLRATEGLVDVNLANPHGWFANVVTGKGLWRSEGIGCENGDLRAGDTWILPAGLDRIRFQADTPELRVLLSRPANFA